MLLAACNDGSPTAPDGPITIDRWLGLNRIDLGGLRIAAEGMVFSDHLGSTAWNRSVASAGLSEEFFMTLAGMVQPGILQVQEFDGVLYQGRIPTQASPGTIAFTAGERRYLSRDGNIEIESVTLPTRPLTPWRQQGWEDLDGPDLGRVTGRLDMRTRVFLIESMPCAPGVIICPVRLTPAGTIPVTVSFHLKLVHMIRSTVSLDLIEAPVPGSWRIGTGGDAFHRVGQHSEVRLGPVEMRRSPLEPRPHSLTVSLHLREPELSSEMEIGAVTPSLADGDASAWPPIWAEVAMTELAGRGLSTGGSVSIGQWSAPSKPLDHGEASGTMDLEVEFWTVLGEQTGEKVRLRVEFTSPVWLPPAGAAQR